jgi:hypothetical protein
MSRKFLILVCLVAISGQQLVSQSVGEENSVNADFRNSTYVGKWNGFYRGQQLQGHLTSERQGLVKVPDYMLEGSFPYRKRKYPEEILFVDMLSIVRFNGGYKEAWAKQVKGVENVEDADMAVLDEEGKLIYNFDWVAKRLDPYIENGYQDFIISLDNVPYAMRAFEANGAYGQIAPPRDYEEWYDFIVALCSHMVDLYGFDLPNSWSFRMGTENNGQGKGDAHTFDGTHEQWIKWYDYSSAAVKKVLPGAKFGPGEFAGQMKDNIEEPKVDYFKLMTHCAEGKNYATGKIGAPLDFIANSSHSVPRYENGKIFGCIWPYERVQWNRDGYNNLIRNYPQYKDVPKYIFQFGHLCSEQTDSELNMNLAGAVGRVISTSEPGGRGAAWTFQTLVGMKEEVPTIKGIWHWGVLESFAGGLDGNPDKSSGDVSSKSIMKSNGWLYSILDYCQGGDAYSLEVPASPDGTVYKILFSVREGNTYLIASAFNADRDNFLPRKVTVKLPREMLGKNLRLAKLLQVEINEQNCVYREVRNDFEKRGLLGPGHAQYSLLAGINQITPPAKRNEVNKSLRENIDKYDKMTIESLTLKPFVGKLSEDGDDYVLTFDIIPASVKAIAFEHTKLK